MWKKAKRILSCILALVLLLSMANGQQVFVQADSEAVIKTQAEDKAGNKEAGGNKEESSSAKTTEKKQETTTEKSTEKPAEKPTETTTESGKEDGKSDKPDKSDENNGKDSEDKDTKKDAEETTGNQGTKKEDKDSEEKSGDKEEETTDAAEETSTEEQGDTAEEIGTTQEDATDGAEEQTESVISTTQSGTEVSGKEIEYVPSSQPSGINIKAYAKENVFPEGTVMKVKELGKKEQDSAESVLEKEKVSYDGFLGYDISFYDKDGKEIEPEDGSVRVEVEMDKSLFPESMQSDTLQMQHLKEEKTKRTVETVAKTTDSKMSVSKSKVTAKFEVKSFSDFILTWNIDATPAAPLKIGVHRAAVQKQISHEKYAVLRNDGTYDLTLTVAGKKGTETNKAKLDVIFILDKSGSMSQGFGSTTKRQAASTAIKNLATSLSGNSNIDSRFSLVTFSGNNNRNEEAWDDAEVAVNWTASAQTVGNGSLPGANGGTNYQAGIRTAKELLTGTREGAMTAVIFVSDGNPTFYYDQNGKTLGNGNNNGSGGSTNLTNSLQAAKNEIANLGVNYFYTVGVGKASDYDNLSALCSSSGVSGARNFDGTNTTELNNAFSAIESEILTFLCSKVSIEDVLSDNVEIVKDANGAFKNLKIEVTDKSGNTIEQGENEITFKDGNDNVTLRASYDSTSRKITLSFPANYSLNADYTYKVTANIDATEKAYADYRKNGNKYTDTGDEGTGTHAGESGMYSNQNSEAKLTYTFREKEYTELYDKPVIKLHPSKLVLEKEIEGLNNLTEDQLIQYKEKLKFVIKVKTKKNTELKSEEKTLKDFELKDGKYIYTVMEGIDPESTYEIQEKDGEIEGYDWNITEDKKSETGTIEKDTTKTVSFKNAYSRQKFSLHINKTVEGNMSDKKKEFTFSISLKDGNGAAYVLSDKEIKEAGLTAKGDAEEGVYTFTLKDGEEKEITLPYGCKYIVSEEDYSSDGYKTYIGEEKEENKKRTTGEETMTQQTEVSFLNKKQVVPPTGVKNTMTAWFLMTGATLVLGAMFLLFGIRRKRLMA